MRRWQKNNILLYWGRRAISFPWVHFIAWFLLHMSVLQPSQITKHNLGVCMAAFFNTRFKPAVYHTAMSESGGFTITSVYCYLSASSCWMRLKRFLKASPKAAPMTRSAACTDSEPANANWFLLLGYMGFYVPRQGRIIYFGLYRAGH